MDRQEQRKRAFSQAFQRMNQPRLEDHNVQLAKRMSNYPHGAPALYHQDLDQENENLSESDYNSAFEQIPGTQIHHPPPVALRHANPALYNYASLQFELYGNGPGPGLKSSSRIMLPPVPAKKGFEGPVFRDSVQPTPEIVRGKSLLGPTPYIRPDSSLSLRYPTDSYDQFGSGLSSCRDADSPMSNTSTAVGPLTPSALNFGDLSLGGSSFSLPSSPQKNSPKNRTTLRFVSTSSFSSLSPEIRPNEVIILFNKGKEARKFDKYPLCNASRFFAKFLDGPFLDAGLTRCLRLRDDFPYAIACMLHFIETGRYMYDHVAFTVHTLLTQLDFHVHAYLVGSKYDIPALQDCAINAYLVTAEQEMKFGFAALASGQVPVVARLDGQAEGGLTTTPIDHFFNSLVLLWKNTQSRHDTMRTAVLELIKRNLSKLLRFPFFVTLMAQLVGFGDHVVASLHDDGFEVKAFQVPVGVPQKHVMHFGD